MTTPVDLAAVQADDALLDDLTSALADDATLAAVLVAWRRDIDSEPIGVLMDTDKAVAVIEANREPASRYRMLGLVVAVLAVLIVVSCALGLVAKGAHPGGLLWPLHEFLYPLDGSR